MNNLPTLFLYGKAKIVAIKTGMLIHVAGDQVLELTPEQVKNIVKEQLYPSEFKTECNLLFLEKTKNDFITAMRLDAELRRRIGGTKWHVQLLDERDNVSAHNSRDAIEAYYRQLVHAKNEATRQIIVARNNEEILNQLDKAFYAL